MLAAFSATAWMLIGARALMGVAGATLAPSTLALIANLFRDPIQRRIGIAVYVSCFMGGAAFGPVVGGILLEWFWWGAVFLLGVPVMAALLIAGPALLPEFRDKEAGALDLVSIALLLLTILPGAYGIKAAAQSGLGPGPVTAIAAGTMAGVVFIRRQAQLSEPLLDLALFRDRVFSTALVVLLCAVATQGGVMLLVGLHLQAVQGLSPLHAGLCGIAPALGMVAGSLITPMVARRTPPGTVIVGGLGLASVGYLLIGQVPTNGLALLMTSATVVFLGIGLVGALANDLVVGSAPPAKAGSAAALAQTSGDLGISLGVAALGSLGTGVYASQLTDTLPEHIPTAAVQAAKSSITAAATTAETLPGAGGELFDAARVAFTGGLHVTATASALLLAVLCVAATWTLRPPQPATNPQNHPHHPDGSADQPLAPK